MTGVRWERVRERGRQRSGKGVRLCARWLGAHGARMLKGVHVADLRPLPPHHAHSDVDSPTAPHATAAAPRGHKLRRDAAGSSDLTYTARWG